MYKTWCERNNSVSNCLSNFELDVRLNARVIHADTLSQQAHLVLFQKTHTFPAVLVSNDNATFAIFLYGDVQNGGSAQVMWFCIIMI